MACSRRRLRRVPISASPLNCRRSRSRRSKARPRLRLLNRRKLSHPIRRGVRAAADFNASHERERKRNMAEITAALVKELREKTGAGMMDCKKALAETKGDLETAFDWLRKKGLAAAAKKAGRVAAEGLVGLTTEG